jgi:hypothetical protein
MTTIIVDAGLLAKLHNLKEPLQLCTESGKVLARVSPVLDPEEYGPLEPQISLEEANRRIASNERRYTTAEVLAILEKLP